MWLRFSHADDFSIKEFLKFGSQEEFTSLIKVKKLETIRKMGSETYASVIEKISTNKKIVSNEHMMKLSV